jgi:apolipoprotein D and lipocalin family protein
MIIGNGTKYLWILAREPRLDPAVLARLLGQARGLGFDTDQLIYPQRQQTGAAND